MARLIAETAQHRVPVRREHSDKATAPHNLSTIIGLDVKGAFDNVSQDSIIGKLYRELNDNPIRHWIRVFMLNRSIRIKLGRFKSKCLALNKGVPQGSALGPILWNYSISDIRQCTRADCLGISLMAYADDLTIISHGSNNYPFVQRTLNRIDRYLQERGLVISTEKSELMHILGPGRRPKVDSLPSYHINGETITPRDQIKILGVTITDQLLLKTENEDSVARLEKAKKLLRHLSINRLVIGSHEWGTLFEAFLKSLLAHNFTALLAIDSKARDWVDKNINQGVMYALGLPRYMPQNILRLLTNIETCDETVAKQLIKGDTNLESPDSLRKAYATLEEIFQGGSLLNYIDKKANDRTVQTPKPTKEPSRPRDHNVNLRNLTRHYHNPEIRFMVYEARSLKLGSLA